MRGRDDIIDILHLFMEFNQEESCGKCTPCREGTSVMMNILEKMKHHSASEEDLEKLLSLGKIMEKASLCGLGQAAPLPLFSVYKHRKKVLKNALRKSVEEGEMNG